jgi:hypothetical protein
MLSLIVRAEIVTETAALSRGVQVQAPAHFGVGLLRMARYTRRQAALVLYDA